MPETLEGKLGLVRPPDYLRKLDKRSHWGHETDSLATRIATAESEVFKPSSDAFSFFRAITDEDFYQIIIGLNALRASSTQQIDFVAFTESEVHSAGIRLTATVGETNCDAANRLHVDASASSLVSVSQLCCKAFDAKREAFRITRSEASVILQEMQDRGCKAVVEAPSCNCVRLWAH